MLATVLDPFHAGAAAQPARDACATFAEAAEALGHNHSTAGGHGDDGGGEGSDGEGHVSADVFAHLAHVAGDSSDSDGRYAVNDGINVPDPDELDPELDTINMRDWYEEYPELDKLNWPSDASDASNASSDGGQDGSGRTAPSGMAPPDAGELQCVHDGSGVAQVSSVACLPAGQASARKLAAGAQAASPGCSRACTGATRCRHGHGNTPPDPGTVHGVSGMAPPDAGEVHGVRGMAAPVPHELLGGAICAGGRALHTQVSLVPMGMRDVHHSRLLEQIRTGTSMPPELQHLRSSADATVVRSGSDVSPPPRSLSWPSHSCFPSARVARRSSGTTR